MKTSITALSMALLSATGAFAQQASGDVNATAAQQTKGELVEMLLAQARTEEQLIAALELQGYTISEMRRSLLGRAIITAENGMHVREVVMSRATGEILSDQITAILGDAGASAAAEGNAEATSNNGLGAAGVGVDVGVSANGQADAAGSGVSVGGNGGASVSIGIGN